MHLDIYQLLSLLIALLIAALSAINFFLNFNKRSHSADFIFLIIFYFLPEFFYFMDLHFMRSVSVKSTLHLFLVILSMPLILGSWHLRDKIGLKKTYAFLRILPYLWLPFLIFLTTRTTYMGHQIFPFSFEKPGWNLMEYATVIHPLIKFSFFVYLFIIFFCMKERQLPWRKKIVTYIPMALFLALYVVAFHLMEIPRYLG